MDGWKMRCKEDGEMGAGIADEAVREGWLGRRRRNPAVGGVSSLAALV